jgi:hypothetical protein
MSKSIENNSNIVEQFGLFSMSFFFTGIQNSRMFGTTQKNKQFSRV